MGFWTRLQTGLLACATMGSFAASVWAQPVPVNGDFESGLTGWTLGGTSNADVLVNTDFDADLSAADWPDGFAVLSTGPGDVAGGPATDIDGAGGANEQDAVTLSAPLSFSGSPRVLRFGWAFASSEEDQPDGFDDVVAVDIDADGDLVTTGDRTRVFSRSSFKPGGSSPFADGPQNGGAAVTIEAGNTVSGTNLRFGVHAREVFCEAIPGTVSGDNNMAVIFTVADQGDATFDSALLLDDVAVTGVCPADLEQLTVSAGSTVEIKDGNIVVSPAVNRRVSVDDDASVVAFVSTGNYTGDNPSGVEQVYVVSGGVFERIAELGVGVLGQIDSVSVSGSGRYLAISAAPEDGDNFEIYRYDRNNSTLLQITDTSGCENVNPTTDDDGVRIAFESTCDSITGAGSVRKVVQRQDNTGAGTLRAFQGTGACEGRNPSVNRAAQARYVVFESSCDHSGDNSDGNVEIFRYDRNNDSFRQITDTIDSPTLTVTNYSAKMDGRNSGRFLVFISNADLTGANADNSTEIFRYDANGGGSLTQVTNDASATAPLYFSVTADIQADDLAFSRLNLLSGFVDAGYLDLGGTEEVIASGTFLNAPQIGMSGPTAVIVFDASGDFVGNNPDNNTEVFRGTLTP